VDEARSAIINRLTSRAWRDDRFRDLLFRRPDEAMREEFGTVPQGFENVTFNPVEVDRVTSRETGKGRSLLVRPKRGAQSISVVLRRVFGVPELVVVFFTKRCQYQCSFCTLPTASAYSEVSTDDIRKQLDHAFEYAGSNLREIELVSLGNEGSILDESTFPREQLNHVLSRCSLLPSIREVVLETRAEFASEALLDDILALIRPSKLTLKIGLESADDRIREEILRKRMNLRDFERVVEMLGRKRIGLASYVLLKADPAHSDEEGREDARKTCEYLKQLCRRTNTDLTLRINAMYRAGGSAWSRWAEDYRWEPPSIFDLAEVMLDVHDDDIRVFAGLYDEGLATADGHYEVRSDFRSWALQMLELYNQTMSLDLVRQVVANRNGHAEASPH
jgi:radical SAM enzyme (TIGR01210 family)